MRSLLVVPLAFALATPACVADRWMAISPSMLDGAAPIAADAALAEASTVADATDDTRCAAPDGGRSICDCDPGQMWCDGVCLEGPTALYRGEDDARDSAGELHGTFTQLGFALGRFGRAFAPRGDATRGYVRLPAQVFDFGDGDFTVAFWINTAGEGNIVAKRLACWGEERFTGLDLRIGRNQIVAEVWSEQQFVQLLAPGIITDGDWHFVAMVRDGGSLALSIDGVTAASSAFTGTMRDPSRTPVDLGVGPCVLDAPSGNGSHDGTPWLNGRVDEFAVFRRALTSIEIAAESAGRCRY